MDNRGSAFDKFRRNSSARSDPTTQMLFDFVKSYRGEIEFINDIHTTHAREVKNFYGSELPAIIKKLEAEPIADDVLYRRPYNSTRLFGRRPLNDTREIFALVKVPPSARRRCFERQPVRRQKQKCSAPLQETLRK